MPAVRELYELWAGDSYYELRDELRRSLEPRGTDSLFAAFAQLGPRPGQVLVDAGTRDAWATIRLVREHGLRAVALDPLPLHVERARAAVDAAGLAREIGVVEGALESMPLGDGSADWIWCRDVLGHVDARRGLRECARVLRVGGTMIAYVTVATERLEPREREELSLAAALHPEGFEPERLRQAAGEAGLTQISEDVVGSEWRERMIEDGGWDAAADLLALARLRRRRDSLERSYGAAAVAAAAGGRLWGVYELLGKLRATVFVWRRDV